jgi:tetratricopeptide (TPR) repeat protein
LEKAIEIKRRAQRCIQNGDLDGALTEYEKLVGAPDSDPYNYVLLADLLYKKGDQNEAAERYLAAVDAYQSASLYKNAIAVCKKMVRLSLSPARVLQSLASLHALDGLSGEAALYYVQYAEHLVRSNAPADAAAALRQAFDVSQENIRVLEQLSEAWLLAGDNTQAAQALLEAARHYRHGGAEADAVRCESRAATLDENASEPAPADAGANGTAAQPEFVLADHLPDPRTLELHHDGHRAGPEAASVADAGMHARMDGLESGRHHHEPLAPEAHDAGAVPAGGPVSLLGDDDDDDVPAPTPVSGRAPSAAPTVDEASTYEIPADEAEAEDEDEDEEEAPAYEIPADDLEEAAAPAAPRAYAPEDADENTVYEIPEMDADALDVQRGTAPVPATAGASGSHEQADASGVYEIEDQDEREPVTGTAGHAGSSSGQVYDLEDATADDAPGAATPAVAPVSSPVQAHHGPEEQALAHVEELLVHAQHQFRSGERDEASMTLAQAAQACETIGRLDNAASIYRSLGRGPHATPAMLEMWLGNCERRGDAAEAGQVACELGDRALNDGDEAAARGWFDRAIAFDPGNETALRRIHRLEQVGGTPAGEPVAPLPAMARPAPEPAPAEGRVEVAVGRAQAVSFDLAGLLAEFQRGVEAQLAGDAQSHYDLGMTYREMGLLEQAMDSFRCAAQDQVFAARALEMVGRCLADQGRLPEAADEFRSALALPGVTPENDGELRYYHGLALAGTGRLAEALAELEAAQERLPGFEDVDQHVADLRQQLGRAA